VTLPILSPGKLSSIGFSTGMVQRLPSELLERRPDIRAAEAGLMAANARIGAARAAWFPTLDLVATMGSGALNAGNLFSGPAALWQVGASVLAPVFDFGRRRAEVDTAEARREGAELQYRATVRNAFREVGDAWTLLDTANTRLEALNRQVVALEAGAVQAERRYANGYSPFLELLDARRALFDAQLAQADATRDRFAATAMLFKAMGGGWEEGLSQAESGSAFKARSNEREQS
jgi:multidrug efflux system outer membrane protein